MIGKSKNMFQGGMIILRIVEHKSLVCLKVDGLKAKGRA
jgi:hypothetical protein